jgi:hypothetical protein
MNDIADRAEFYDENSHSFPMVPPRGEITEMGLQSDLERPKTCGNLVSGYDILFFRGPHLTRTPLL